MSRDFIYFLSYETNLCHVKISDYKYEKKEARGNVRQLRNGLGVESCRYSVINLWHNISKKKFTHSFFKQ